MPATINETMKACKFGVEIETIGLSRTKLAEAIHGVVGGSVALGYGAAVVTAPDGRSWQVVHDGSLSGGAEGSGEVVTPVLTHGDIEILQNVIRALRAAGARVDESCGVHVHVSHASLDPAAVARLAKMVRKQENLLIAALGIHNCRSFYCKAMATEVFDRIAGLRRDVTRDALALAWYGYRLTGTANRRDDSRYHGLNVNSYFFRKTVEFRYFNGTLHAGEIKAYIQLCTSIVGRAIEIRNARGGEARPLNPLTSKYDLRVWLLGLGLIGDEFKTARLHLMKKMGGSAAWRGERRDRRTVAVAVAPVAGPVVDGTMTGRLDA